MSFKDIWFQEMERRTAELEDQGLSFDQAYDQASDEAYTLAADRIADMADAERKRRKEDGA